MLARRTTVCILDDRPEAKNEHLDEMNVGVKELSKDHLYLRPDFCTCKTGFVIKNKTKQNKTCASLKFSHPYIAPANEHASIH